ncbi:MAG: YraN family protein [Oscillospiraceae bacterium]|nr:YraN family protein [Oscillospiraceae bacterium]
MNKTETGRLGENAISEYLSARGYRIICRNYRIKGGEIDIIASKDDFIAFVEVKTRRPDSLESGFDAVNQKKRNFIIKTAIDYILKYPSELQPRFDIASVIALNGKVLDINYIKNAYDATGYNF